MFGGLLKSKFYNKCKSQMKLTMKRIEIIRRKRNAMHKFMRNDVADLLETGLDSIACGRVVQLYADQNLSWCYEFIEQSCVLILSHLSVMNKQRECPEECKEAVSTLIFAAARFADLPELRELRSLFTKRYGNNLEPYVNKQFFKNLKTDPPTTRIKLQMMQEVALEYSIDWDSTALEQKMYKPPPFVQDWSQYTNGRNNESVENDPETNIGKSLPYKSRAEVETEKDETRDHGRLSPCWSSNTSYGSESMTSADDSASEDIPQGRKLPEFRSPYIKTESTETDVDVESGIPQGRKSNGLRAMGPPYTKPDLSKKTVAIVVDNDNLKSEDDISKPVVPRSVRIQRPLKQAAGSSHGDNDVLKTSPDISNGENKEEKKMDKLLSHYSSKPSRLPAPKRTSSLPSEPVAAAGEERKGLTRATTYQPGHVHPKLPDYDDFVARLAAFRASS